MLGFRTAAVRSRALVAGLAVCLGAGLVSAATPATARTGVVTLAGTNTIKLSATGASMLVDVPNAVAAKGPCIGSTQVNVTGTADAVVVMLIPQGVINPQPVVFGRLPHRGGAQTFFSNCGRDGTTLYLVAGRYRLVALRSSGTATVTLKLWTMTGSRRLSPHAVPGAVIKDLPAVQPYAATVTVASYGATAQLSSTGLVWAIGWNRLSQTAQEWQHTCVIGGTAATTVPLGVLVSPGCPWSGEGMFVTRLSDPNETLWSSGRLDLSADTYAAGYSLTTYAPVAESGAIGIWMPT